MIEYVRGELVELTPALAVIEAGSTHTVAFKAKRM